MALGHDVQKNPEEKCGLCSARNARASSSCSGKQTPSVSYLIQPQKPHHWHSLICREPVFAGWHPSQLPWLPQAQPLDRVLRAEVATLVPDQVPPRPAAFRAPGSLCEQLRWSISLWGTYTLLWPARIKAYSYLNSHCSEH